MIVQELFTSYLASIKKYWDNTKSSSLEYFQPSVTMMCLYLYTKQNLFMYLNVVMMCTLCAQGAGFGSSCCQYSTICRLA